MKIRPVGAELLYVNKLRLDRYDQASNFRAILRTRLIRYPGVSAHLKYTIVQSSDEPLRATGSLLRKKRGQQKRRVLSGGGIRRF